MPKYDKALVQQFMDGAGDDAALAWLAGSGDLSSVDTNVAMAAIQAAVLKQDVARLQSLEDAPKVLRKAGRAGLHRLKTQGVTIDKPAPKNSFTLGKASISVPPRAFVSPPDMDGYSAFMLSITDDEGTCVVMGYFGGAEGFKNLSHGHTSRGELRRLSKEIREGEPDMVEMPFHEGLGHVLMAADTAKTLTGGLPHDWEHFTEHLTPEMENSARILDPVARLAKTVDEGLLADTEALIHNAWFVPWPVSEEAVQHLTEALIATAQGDGDEGDRNEKIDGVLKQAAAKGLDAEARAEWIRRARLATSAMAASGDSSAAEVAANMTRALEAGLGGEKIPLVERSVQFMLARFASSLEANPPQLG